MTSAELIECIGVWVNAKCDDSSKIDHIRGLLSTGVEDFPEQQQEEEESPDTKFERGFDYDAAIERINKLTRYIGGRR